MFRYLFQLSIAIPSYKIMMFLECRYLSSSRATWCFKSRLGWKYCNKFRQICFVTEDSNFVSKLWMCAEWECSYGTLMTLRNRVEEKGFVSTKTHSSGIPDWIILVLYLNSLGGKKISETKIIFFFFVIIHHQIEKSL